MQYYPVFDHMEHEFIGVVRFNKPQAKRLKFPCLLIHTHDEIKRHLSLLNEIENERFDNIDDKDQYFLDHYNTFYVDLVKDDFGYEIGIINLTPYSDENIKDIKDFLSFSLTHFKDV